MNEGDPGEEQETRFRRWNERRSLAGSPPSCVCCGRKGGDSSEGNKAAGDYAAALVMT